ncbi:hypothetical protein P4133_34835 [Pseudomonas aeruginosa]|nr:hypothetical protein [Pseudomonas aeruginosa]
MTFRLFSTAGDRHGVFIEPSPNRHEDTPSIRGFGMTWRAAHGLLWRYLGPHRSRLASDRHDEELEQELLDDELNLDELFGPEQRMRPAS